MKKLLILFSFFVLAAQIPKPIPGGYDLPNGWRITPAGRHVTTSDYILNLTSTPDGRNLIALHCGYNPHGLLVIDPKTVEITGRTPLKSAWYGMAWNPDGKTLYVSGGNGESRSNPTAAPIYALSYEN